MDLKEQLYVTKLAECGNITEAAKELYITQPALSMYINSLEITMGVKLFKRIKNKYVLTYIGEKYVEKAKEMLKLQSEFKSQLDEVIGGYDNRVRIGVQMRRSPYVVASMLSKARELLPNLNIRIIESDNKGLEKLLFENELDIIVYNCEKRNSGLCYEHVFNDRVLLAVPQNSKFRLLGEWREEDSKFQWIDLHIFKNETFILPFPRQSLRDTSEIIFNEEKFSPKRIIELRNIRTIMQLVSEGFGVGFNRESYLNHMKDIDNIIYYNISSDSFSSELVISYCKNNKYSEWFYKIIEIVKGVMQESIL